MMRLARLALFAVIGTGAVSCGKHPAPPARAPEKTTLGVVAWPDEPTGALWEALGKIPAASRGKIGLLEFAAARALHDPYAEPAHERWTENADGVFVSLIKIPEADLKRLLWAELVPDGGPSWSFMAVQASTPAEKVREALKAASYERAPGEDDIWRPAKEPESFVPERILLRDGWIARTLDGDAAVGALLKAWNGAAPSLQSAPHVRTLAAGIGSLLPAAIRFGIDDAPIPESPLRVVAMVIAPDTASREEVVVVAFNDPNGPDTMLASSQWKSQMEALKQAPATDRKGPCLRVRTRPR